MAILRRIKALVILGVLVGMGWSAGALVHAQSTEQAKLTASDGALGDQFGNTVSIAGNTAVVGAVLDDTTAGSEAGSAYVFVRTGTTWTQQAKLIASVPAVSDFFGLTVVIAGNTVVVGAPFDDTTRGSDAGSAYVFVRTGTTWTQQARLTASDGAASDVFGFSVAIAGNTVVVGAVGDDTFQGSAYVFA